MAECWLRLEQAGAAPVGSGVWETLRIEAGLPAFGADMDGATIPVEAGLADRAIDHDKGCYTGQEVIVRIRDRGTRQLAPAGSALRGRLAGAGRQALRGGRCEGAGGA